MYWLQQKASVSQYGVVKFSAGRPAILRCFVDPRTSLKHKACVL